MALKKTGLAILPVILFRQPWNIFFSIHFNFCRKTLLTLKKNVSTISVKMNCSLTNHKNRGYSFCKLNWNTKWF